MVRSAGAESAAGLGGGGFFVGRLYRMEQMILEVKEGAACISE